MKDGTPLVEGALAMEYDEYKYTQIVLFRQEKYEEAAFCGLDQTMTGRISEGTDVFWSIFKVHPTLFHLQSKWYRGKTKTVCDDINIFPSLEAPEYCSIHALATWAAMRQSIDTKLFQTLSTLQTSCGKNKQIVTVSQKMNDTLKDIKTFYDDDTSLNKPAIYRSGLTTHSLRHMGVNMLVQNNQIKEEWREMRTQHANRDGKSQIKTVKNAYIKFDYVTDAPCGKCLANQHYIFLNAKCPYINVLPVTDQNTFHLFTIELLKSISYVDISVRYLFSAILTMWFNYNVQNNSNSSLVKRMINIADNISGCNLSLWSSTLKKFMDEQNYLHLPISALTGGESGAVVVDALTTTSTALKFLQHDISEVKNSQLSQESINQCVATKLDCLQSKLDLTIEILTELRQNNMQIKKRKVIQPSISLFYNNNQINNSNTQNTLDSGNNEHDESNITLSNEFKMEDLKSAMFQWYTKLLFKLPLANLTTDEKSQLHKCSKIITYMKLFIASDCEIFAKQINHMDADYNKWLDDLHVLCYNTQDLVMSFLDQNHFNKYGTNLKAVIKYKARFESTYKMLESVPKNEFPSNGAIVDVIFTSMTSLHPFYENIHQWEKKIKK